MTENLDTASKPSVNSKKPRLGRGIGSLITGPLLSDLGGPTDSERSPSATSDKVDTQAEPVTLPRTQSVSSHAANRTAYLDSQKLNLDSQRLELDSQNPSLDIQRIWNLEIHKVRPNLRQPRKQFAKEHLEELSASIKEKGILQPITVRKTADDHFEIIAGERRWRAAQLAGLEKVPVIIRTADDQDSLELALIENIQRQELNPIEEAQAYQRLSSEFSMTQAEIAQKVGKDRATIANTLRLLTLPQQVREMIVEGKISMGHGKALMQIEDTKIQNEVAKKVAQDRLTVRATERLAQQLAKQAMSLSSGNEKSSNGDDDVAALLVKNLGDELQRLIGTKVEIRYTAGKGQFLIHFYSDEEFNDIVEHMRESWKK